MLCFGFLLHLFVSKLVALSPEQTGHERVAANLAKAHALISLCHK